MPQWCVVGLVGVELRTNKTQGRGLAGDPTERRIVAEEKPVEVAEEKPQVKAPAGCGWYRREYDHPYNGIGQLYITYGRAKTRCGVVPRNPVPRGGGLWLFPLEPHQGLLGHSCPRRGHEEGRGLDGPHTSSRDRALQWLAGRPPRRAADRGLGDAGRPPPPQPRSDSEIYFGR